MPDYTVHFVDRMPQSLPVGNRLKCALKKAVEYIPRNVYEAYVREWTDGAVTAQWEFDYKAKKFVPFSARAAFERHIEADEAELRVRRELLPTIDAVMAALRSAGVHAAQCEPSTKGRWDAAEWRWSRERASVQVFTDTDNTRAVQWEVRTWGPGIFSGETRNGILTVENGVVVLPPELLETIKNCKRCF